MRNALIAAATCWLVALPCIGHADRVAGEKKAALCLNCHAAKGESFNPVLDDQPPAYFIAQMTAYKTGKRDNYGMNINAASLSAGDIRDLADFFASRKSRPYPVFDAKKAAAGMKALSRLPCSSCHGSDYSGHGPIARLAGQSPKYLAWELQYIRSGNRSHPTSNGGDAVKTLRDADIVNVAQALASLN